MSPLSFSNNVACFHFLNPLIVSWRYLALQSLSSQLYAVPKNEDIFFHKHNVITCKEIHSNSITLSYIQSIFKAYSNLCNCLKNIYSCVAVPLFLMFHSKIQSRFLHCTGHSLSQLTYRMSHILDLSEFSLMENFFQLVPPPTHL